MRGAVTPNAADAAAQADVECRCDCGSLLARWRDGAIELKCRRCKRRVVLEVTPPREKVPRVS
jgi:phage FluMu protein Com